MASRCRPRAGAACARPSSAPTPLSGACCQTSSTPRMQVGPVMLRNCGIAALGDAATSQRSSCMTPLVEPERAMGILHSLTPTICLVSMGLTVGVPGRGWLCGCGGSGGRQECAEGGRAAAPAVPPPLPLRQPGWQLQGRPAVRSPRYAADGAMHMSCCQTPLS